MAWLTSFGIIIVGGLVIYWVLQKVVLLPGRSLRSKFRAAGVLKGRTKAEIVSKVGQPQYSTKYDGGTSLLMWQATGYHASLRFDINDVCLGVDDEYVDRNIGGVAVARNAVSEFPDTCGLTTAKTRRRGPANSRLPRPQRTSARAAVRALWWALLFAAIAGARLVEKGDGVGGDGV